MRHALLALLLAAPAAWAQHEKIGGHEPEEIFPPDVIAGEEAEAKSAEHHSAQVLNCAHEGEANLSDVIFHHVSDDYTLEIPWPGHWACVLTLGRPHTAVEEYPSLLGTWTIPIGEKVLDITPTRHVFFLWVGALLVLVLMTLATRSYRKKGGIQPSGIGSLVEMIVVYIRDEMAIKNIGKHHADHYLPYLLTAFFFILTVNMLGLIPYSATATANVNVTGSLAALTFLTTLLAGMRSQGIVGYWKHLVPAAVPLWLWPIMLPVEILGLFTKPFALCIRLFANMIAGHIVIFFLLGLIFILKTVYIAPVSVAFALGIFLLEIFVALVQAYIFTMLSSLFIGMAAHAH